MEKFVWQDTRKEVTLNTAAAAATSRPGTRCNPEGSRQDASLGNNNYRGQSDGSWSSGSLYGRPPDEMFQETVHSPALFHRPKSRGLTLSSLDRLSPSMVTLQSLVSDWPPNTVDSGYEPSPLSGDIFTYSEDDIQQGSVGQSSVSWRSNGSYLQSFAELSHSFIGARSKQRVKPDFNEHDSMAECPLRSPPHQIPGAGDGNCKTTPLLSKVINMERNSPMSATPPIAIPRNAASLSRHCYPVSPLNDRNPNGEKSTEKCQDSSATSESFLSRYSEHQSYGEFIPAMSGIGYAHREANSRSTRDQQVSEGRNLRSSNHGDGQDDMSGLKDSPSSSYYRRPRTYSCPETCRPTPTRPPVPLFSSQTPGPSDLHSGNQNLISYTQNTDCLATANSQAHYCPPFQLLPRASTDPSSSASSGVSEWKNPTQGVQVHRETGPGSGGFVPPGGIVHSRNWSSPVTSPGRDSRPLFLPPMPPRTVSLKPAGSREGIVDLSDDGPGHRRRVLVLALPDVVVDTHHHQGGFQGRGQDPHSPPPGTLGQACPSHHSRQGSSSGDSLPPLRSSPAALPPSRRAWTRPRALSCDVTLEETAGRALRKIADDFESGRRRSRDQSLSFLGRVRRSFRRSFSKLLTGHASDDDLDPRQVHSGATVDFFEERQREVTCSVDAFATKTRRIRRQSYVNAATHHMMLATSFSTSAPHHVASADYTPSAFSSSEEDESDDECFGSPSNDDAKFVLYDLAVTEEDGGNEEEEPRYSLTRRGGDDFEYFL